MNIPAFNEDLMRTNDCHDSSVRRPKIDLDRTSDKNSPADGLVKPACKFAKSFTKINSKFQEPETYNEAIINPVYENKWQKAIDKKLWNLNFYQT